MNAIVSTMIISSYNEVQKFPYHVVRRSYLHLILFMFTHPPHPHISFSHTLSHFHTLTHPHISSSHTSTPSHTLTSHPHTSTPSHLILTHLHTLTPPYTPSHLILTHLHTLTPPHTPSHLILTHLHTLTPPHPSPSPVCNRLLSSGGYFMKNDVYYCSKDYHTLFGTKCLTCGEYVEGRVVTALGKSYHPHCFTCDRCK